ncbi:MAG TPA: phosphoribosylamine--glycine ligase, partial [Acidimicrobiales bacterium]|nr:phosphoribosylamine--glycine ligase [Acidimicrobiales bacterium]
MSVPAATSSFASAHDAIKTPMKVCVVGSGGREHALAIALARTASVVVTPGNPGISALTALNQDVACTCTAQAPEEVEADLYVIGPEVPLVDGLADRLRARDKLVFGPGADGARLEGSKAWMKQLLLDAGVPTAAHGTFAEVEPAVAFLRRMPAGRYVVKTDGLAAGKGVLVTSDLAEAIDDARTKLDGSAFGDAGRRVVIEEGLTGEELSVMAVCDGRRAVPLVAAQDFKRLGDDDTGPNTGGMGSYSPVPWAGQHLVETAMAEAVEPTLAALRAQGIDYRGVLYAGLMLTPDGLKVLEFNVRFGDPETQVLLPRWPGDVAEVLAAAANGKLGSADVPPPSFDDQAAVCVVLATDGYPTAPRAGDVIDGLDEAGTIEGVELYSAGISRDTRGRLLTGGGRVLGVTGLGATLSQARQRAYDAATRIDWPGVQYRRDIAEQAATAAVSPGQEVP